MTRLSLHFLLLAAVFFSAIAVVVARHETRSLSIEFRTLEKQHDALIEEWERIQLEKSTWATNDRIESVARTQLNMIPTDRDRVLWVVQ